MLISEKGIERLDTSEGHLFEKPGGGSSAIYGPDGVQLTKDMDECTEGVLYANIDLDDILKVKSFLDGCGHYGRPDLLWLGVDPVAKNHVRS